MILEVEFIENDKSFNTDFEESSQEFDADFGETYAGAFEAGKQAGYNSGYNDGNAAGIETGKKAEHSKMWDRLQLNGELTDYSTQTGYFYGKLFGFSNFYPKHDIRPIGDASRLFYAWENKYNDQIGSLKQRLDECSVVLDTSQATLLTHAFSYNSMSEIPTIDCTGLTGNSLYVFASAYARLITIEKIITKESVTYYRWFQNTNLTNITFEGVIGKDIDLSYGSKLTVASMKSIILHLKNYLNTDNEYLYTVNFSSACWDKLEADSTAPNGDTWKNYVVYVLGWNA